MVPFSPFLLITNILRQWSHSKETSAKAASICCFYSSTSDVKNIYSLSSVPDFVRVAA